MPWCEWLWFLPCLPTRRGRALGDRLVVRRKSISQLLLPSLHTLSLRLRLVHLLSIRRRRFSRVVKGGPLLIGSTPYDFAPTPYPTPWW